MHEKYSISILTLNIDFDNFTRITQGVPYNCNA